MPTLRRVVSAAHLPLVDSHRPRETRTAPAPSAARRAAPRAPVSAPLPPHLEGLRAHVNPRHWGAIAEACEAENNLAVVESIKELLDRGLASGHMYPLLRALGQLDNLGTRAVCDILALIVSSISRNASEWDEFVWTLSEIDPERGVRATRLAMRLRESADWSLSTWGDVIKACTFIALEHEAEFVQVVAQLSHLKGAWTTVVTMLSQCPMLAWACFAECVQVIESKYGRDLLTALRCLRRLPIEEWRGYTRALCAFFQAKRDTRSWAGWDRAEVCSAIAALPAEGREDIAVMVTEVPHWEESVYARQMRLLALVPADARRNVLAFVNALLERGLDQETVLRLPQLAVRTPASFLPMAAFTPNADFNVTARAIARVLLRMPTPLKNGWDRLPLGALWPLRDAIVQNLDAAFPGVGEAIEAGRFDPKSDSHRRYSFFAALKHRHAKRIASPTVGWASLTESVWNETCAQGEMRIQGYHGDSNTIARILLANARFAANRQAALYRVAAQSIECMTEGEHANLARLLAVYDLRSANAWTRLAERALLAWPTFAYYIAEIPVTDQGTRVHLARLVGHRDPDTLLGSLDRFGITDQGARMDLVRVCQQRGCDVLPYIKNIALTPEAEKKLLAECLLHNANQVYTLDPKDYPEFNRLSLAVSAAMPAAGSDEVDPAKVALEELIIAEDLDPNHWRWIGESLPSRMDREMTRRQVALIATAVFQVKHCMDAHGAAWLSESGLLQDVLCMRVPFLRPSMLALVVAVARSADARAAFTASTPLRLAALHPEARLLHAVAQYGRSRGIYTAPFENALDTTFYNKFKDSTKLRPLLAACKKVVETDQLTVDEKSAIFASLAAANSGAEAHDASCHLSLLTELGSFALLKDVSKGFLPLAETVLARHLGTLNVPDAVRKYSRTFGNARQPFGVWQYAARLRQLHDRRPYQALTWFIVDVLNEKHATHRIMGLNNPHIALLNRQAGYAMTAWHGERVSDVLATEGPQGNAFAHHHLHVVDTADPYHLLYCGTDVPKSCLRIDSDPRLTCGLVGYLLNGQTRLLAVVDKNTNRIIARAILRCLTDGTQPVLYRERVYGDVSFTDAIDRLGLDKAQLMNVPYTAAHCTWPGAASYGKVLRSVGGRAPSEWVDGTGRMEENSEFEIPSSDVLWMPEPLPAHLGVPRRRARSVPRRAWGLA